MYPRSERIQQLGKQIDALSSALGVPMSEEEVRDGEVMELRAQALLLLRQRKAEYNELTAESRAYHRMVNERRARLEAAKRQARLTGKPVVFQL